MIDVFGWLRRKAAEAVVLGTADGIRAVSPDGEEPPSNLTELRALLASAAEPKAIAAPEAAEETAGKRGRK